MTCPHCGSADTIERPTPEGPSYARLECADPDCRRWIKFVPRPLTLESVAAFVMPYGKHKGTAMADLPRDYVVWMANNLGGRPGGEGIRRKAAFYLDATREGAPTP